MVLSRQPDQPLETAADTALERSYRDSAAISRHDFETSVRGHLEFAGHMQERELSEVTGLRESKSRGLFSGRRLARRRCDGCMQVGRLLSTQQVRSLMTGLWPGVFMGLFLFLGVGARPAQAQSASAWNKRGQNAEARQDYDAAFEDYRQAHLKRPKDLRYQTRYERLRFEAANMHVDRGRVLRQSGDVDGAINEFARSLQIDPGNEAAAQELALTEQKRSAGPAAAAGGVAGEGGAPAVGAGPRAAGGTGGIGPGKVLVPGIGEQSPYQQEVQKDIASMGGPVTLQPVSNDPITLSMVEDTKAIYQAVGKAAGLNVIFDPDYVSKRIPVNLNSVSLPDALRIVGVLSGTFWKPVTSNTIFVAQNNRTKRTDLDDLDVQTFYLTNASQQADANEILVALRNLLDPSVKLYLVASQNAIVMRATSDELILAEKLINDLDRAKAEVVIDVAVLEVSRQKERDLGITLPTSFGLTPQASNLNVSNSTSNTTNPVTTNGVTTGTPTTGVTLNTLGNLNATNFAVSISGGTVNALLSDSDTRILQNPRIRATDGQEASLKIGSKIPVATGSYSAGTAITTASLGVQTQFTYLDVGVNIDITPTVHYDREVSLKLKVEISSQNGSVTISGVTEPIISQRVAQQVIELKDGEPSILAGLLQQQDTHTVSGTPGLGELPFLKYFFSSQDKVQQTDEIVFLMIPHIVRESLLTDENTRAVYTGTSQSVELLRKNPAQLAKAEAPVAGTDLGSPNLQPTSAAMAANAMLGKMAAEGRPLTPGGMAAAGGGPTMGTVPPGGSARPPITLTVTPLVENQPVGSTFTVAVNATSALDLFSVPLQMQFDPRVLQLVNVDSGPLLAGDMSKGTMQAVALVHRDEGNGAVTISATRPPGTKGVDGQGTICTLTFKTLAPGDSTLALTRIGPRDSQQNVIPAVGVQAVVHVK
jgi:general secretion pathway protein D